MSNDSLTAARKAKNDKFHTPTVVRHFYISGYQPAQKWLKDRKRRILDFEYIMHFQRIIKDLTDRTRVMREIDKFDLTTYKSN